MSEINCNYKETAAFLIPKEHLAFTKDDKGLKEYIINRLSSELANRIMDILELEKEIIVSQSNLRANECMFINSVEYKQQINWSPLVRCKDCIHSDTFPEDADNDMPLKCLGIRYGGVMPDWYCEHAERRTDDLG